MEYINPKSGIVINYRFYVVIEIEKCVENTNSKNGTEAWLKIKNTNNCITGISVLRDDIKKLKIRVVSGTIDQTFSSRQIAHIRKYWKLRNMATHKIRTSGILGLILDFTNIETITEKEGMVYFQSEYILYFRKRRSM